ncbi:MAG: hypothetical protein ACETWM_17240 [Candidatus Lokiarchaeia archaeon]
MVLNTAINTLNSIKVKFDTSQQIQHREALILSTDCVEFALKSLRMKLLGWIPDEVKKKISHNLSDTFKYISGSFNIKELVVKFDNNDWSWIRQYPEYCYSAQTTTIFPEDPIPFAQEIIEWVKSKFYK